MQHLHYSDNAAPNEANSDTRTTESRHMIANVAKHIGYSILFVGAGLLFYYSASVSLSEGIENFVGAAPDWIPYVSLPMIVVGAFAYYRARQMMAKNAAVAVLRSDKPSVMYLRSFATDSSLLRTIAFHAFYGINALTQFSTEEEQIRDAFKPVGELLTIGRPGEKLPLPGAPRIYATESEWRQKVETLILHARLIVMRAGTTDALQWELASVVGSSRLDDFVILVWRLSKKEYRRFKEQADRVLPNPLPDGGLFRIAACFIVFRDGVPERVALKGPFLRCFGFNVLQRRTIHALRPLFEARSISWRPAPLSPIALFSLATLFVLVLVFVLALLALFGVLR